MSINKNQTDLTKKNDLSSIKLEMKILYHVGVPQEIRYNRDVK